MSENRMVVATNDIVQIIEGAEQGATGATGAAGEDGASGTGLSEKAYAQIASPTAIGTSIADVTGLSVTFTAGPRPIMLRVYLPQGFFSGAAKPIAIRADITNSGGTTFGSGTSQTTIPDAGVAFTNSGIVAEIRLGSLTDGVAYTFKVRAFATLAGLILASSTTPAFLQALEI